MAAPTLAAIQDIIVPAGSTLMVALSGSDADNNALSFTASSSNGSLFAPTVMPSTNRSLRINVQGYGEMDLQLFENLTPNTAARIIQFAQQGFYNHGTTAGQPMIFHRIIKDFMIQGGDPTGTGSGSSGVTPIGLELNADLNFNSSGVLGMARTSDPNSNDSQFFITTGPAAWLNQQYTVFGFLTKGTSVLQTLNNVQTGANDRPTTNVVVSSAQVYTDTSNGVLMLKTQAGASGYSDITVTVSDGTGGTAQRTFRVHTYVKPISDVHLTAGAAGTTITIPTQNANNDTLEYSIDTSSVPGLTAGTPSSSGSFTLAANTLVAGLNVINVNVRKAGTTEWDTQAVKVYVNPAAPTGLTLIGGTTTNLNNSTGKPLRFSLGGVLDGALVTLKDELGRVLFSGTNYTRSGDNVEITTNGQVTLSDGSHQIRATQTYQDLTSATTAALAITMDTGAPQITSTPSSYVRLGQAYTYNVTTNSPAGQTLTYSLTTAPDGMTIGQNTGVLTWPNATPAGDQSVVVRVADAAGNATTQNFILHVLDANSGPVIDLPTVSGGARVTLRRSGANLQLVNDRTGALLYNEALASTLSMKILGVAGQSDQLSIALNSGGNFSLPGGIIFQGGSGGTDTLIIHGTTAADTLEVNGDTVTANGLATTLSGMQQLRLEGDAGNDTYKLTSSSIPVSVVDSAGLDKLDFSAITGSKGVTLDLGKNAGQTQTIAPWNTTLALTGNISQVIGTNFADTLAGGAAATTILRGQGGADTLRAGSGKTVLLGGAGDDTLYGGAAKGLLIGGAGVDTLRGGVGDDILIGGTTSSDSNDTALMSILDQNSARGYFGTSMRRFLSRSSTMAGTSPLKIGTTVQDDGTHNVLFGGGGFDWFLPGKADEVRRA